MAITDRRLMAPDPIAKAQRLIEELGPRLILQIREKDLEPSECLAWVRRLAPVADANGTALLINGRLDVARSANVGVHLPERGLPIGSAAALLRDSPERIISVARHSAHAARLAAQEGAHIVLLSPIFVTPGKGPPLGLGELQRAVVHFAQPRTHARLFALGGIGPTHAAAVWATGVDGVAAIRSVWEGDAHRLLGQP
ncbi:MAG: thiamine phosphate synthase [Deltaproteobacteria bacterium]|nr:thiamine phosphate synthase [Deltaproteobacteria bacterium]